MTSFSLQGWSKKSSQSILESKDNTAIESLVLLLKCLKIMENATFLSTDNQVTSIYLPVVDCLSVSLNSWMLSSLPVLFQNHLLQMKGKFDSLNSPRSFTKLILSVIKILSGTTAPYFSSKKNKIKKLTLHFCFPFFHFHIAFFFVSWLMMLPVCQLVWIFRGLPV